MANIFDWVEVRAAGRQVAQLGPARGDCFGDTFDLVRGQVVHDDDVVGRQGRGQELLDIGKESSPFMGPSITHGASIRSWRSAATNVVVFQCP